MIRGPQPQRRRWWSNVCLKHLWHSILWWRVMMGGRSRVESRESHFWWIHSQQHTLMKLTSTFKWCQNCLVLRTEKYILPLWESPQKWQRYTQTLKCCLVNLPARFIIVCKWDKASSYTSTSGSWYQLICSLLPQNYYQQHTHIYQTSWSSLHSQGEQKKGEADFRKVIC